ncbi:MULTISPECIES: ABC transporter ATP-binding protein [Glaesserella]|uniref:Cobalamin ABC transporter ATP-binding protein n=1 Tax=Glaesserella australis TaxID=2094024 RepID=A0A328BYX0_9PAST|nr:MULTISPECIES: ABC transporter ATP-binding protein [Glaesserella]AUI65998.1 cobalamin ABC transporter ATP-binding protein [Glaesserella sp. 15-184]RAL18282.1 cobalamin ABC transporter ATP-binding protein [Glaesserella australis]
MLNVKNIVFKRGERTILNDVSLSLEKGELLTLLGANGVGKSTLLNCIAGLLVPNQGDVLLNGISLSRLSAKQVARQIAYISQHSPQTYQYSVKDYVVLGRASHLNMFDKPSEADYQLVEDALQRLGISHLIDHIYMQLSGGQKQLVNIAKVLVQQPQLILFDEPTSALDYGNVFKVLRLIQTLAEHQFTVIMTTHNPEHPILLHHKLPHSKTALLTSEGKLCVGNTADIITEPNLTQLYQYANLRLFNVAELERKVCTISRL